MKLPFFKDKEEKQEYFLALLLLDEKANAVILESIDGKIQIVNSHEEPFSGSIENIAEEEFINVIDKAISTAEEKLPPNIETHKTIFGVKESWIEEETKKIKKEYLSNLKKMCNSLNLSPIGFMVTSEAITHIMQEEEGAPLSAVFVELGKSYAAVSLYRGGKIIEKVQGELGESLPASVDKLLQHFTTPVLPARIILFHAEKGERLAQQFISHHWTKTIPFLHMPQITILPEGFDARAVTAGAATQMGLQVNLLKELLPQEIMPEEKKEAVVEASTDVEAKSDNAGEPKEETEETPLRQGDLPHQPEKAHHVPDNFHTPSANAEDFGFILGQDITETEPPVHKHHAPTHAPTHEPIHSTHHFPKFHAEEVPDNEDEETKDIENTYNRDQKSPLVHQPRLTWSRLSPLALLTPLKNIHLPKRGTINLRGGPLKILIPLAALVIAFLVLTFYYFFQTKATVYLTVKPKIVEQTANVTFSISSPSDFSKNVVAAKSVTATVNGELSKDATGKKDIGDKAKGTVTIYNNSDDSAELSSGTTIKSSNGLLFTLDKDVKIASASGDIFSGTKPGTTNAPVTAKEIGTDYNLPSNTKFSIGGNSTIAAKNDSAFSGGSKKSVTVVSKEDLAKLKSELPKKLEAQAKEALAQKAESGETVLPIFLDTTLEKTTFDKEADDEAKKVKLTATVSFTAIAYRNDDLNTYAQSLLKNKYSEDISFAENSIKATIKETKSKNEKAAQTTTVLTAGLLPQIDTEEVKNKLKDSSPSKVKEIVNSLPQVTQSDIAFSPNMALLANIFPRLPKNVTVEVRSE